MNVGRTLALRIVLVAFASGLLGIALARVSTNVAATQAVADGLNAHFAGGERARCEAAPDGYSLRFGAGFRAFAYDEATRRSGSMEAPPLRADLAAQATRVGAFGAERASPWRGERAMVVRVADGGPCALVLATWQTRLFTVRLARGLGGSALASALLSAVLGLWLVARPLGRRAARLSHAAAALGVASAPGSTSGDRSRPTNAGDELAAVEEALAEAAVRIDRDAQTLRRRAAVLERHLEDVAHDLRTPLASLQLAVQGAQASVNEGSPEAAHLEDALRGCVFLDALIGDLRDAARLEGGWDPGSSAPGEPHDLVGSIERVVRRARVLARSRAIVVEHAVPESPVLVSGDPLATERVLENLVLNAIEHGPPGGHVAIVLHAEPTRFVIELLDEGPGLRVFPPAESPQKEPPRGIRGRGLHVVAALLDRLRWTLTLTADAEGTRARIEGPRIDAPASTAG